MRTASQKPIVFFANEEFLRQVDQGCEMVGCGRSQFIRDALFEMLKRLGFEMSPTLKAAPSRKGKGGTPSHKKQQAANNP
jgi:hypothetical protein